MGSFVGMICYERKTGLNLKIKSIIFQSSKFKKLNGFKQACIDLL